MCCYLKSLLTVLKAVQFEQKKYEECISTCQKTVEKGRAVYAPYNLIAKAFARQGNAYSKLERYEEARDAYTKSLTEDRTGTVLEALRKTEKIIEEIKQKEYFSTEESLKARNRGNEHFKEGRFPEAIKEYDEAIARNPSNAINHSNKAAALMKLGEFREAEKCCDRCIALDDKFIKGYTRKAQCQFFMKQYHKCLQTYEEAELHCSLKLTFNGC